MAYFTQENKKELAPAVKAVFKKYNMKGSLSVKHHSVFRVTIQSGVIDFGLNQSQINHHWIDKNFSENEDARNFLKELRAAMMTGNYNNSDIMSDYFDVGWYVDINVGAWNKPYVLTK